MGFNIIRVASDQPGLRLRHGGLIMSSIVLPVRGAIPVDFHRHMLQNQSFHNKSLLCTSRLFSQVKEAFNESKTSQLFSQEPLSQLGQGNSYHHIGNCSQTEDESSSDRRWFEHWGTDPMSPKVDCGAPSSQDWTRAPTPSTTTTYCHCASLVRYFHYPKTKHTTRNVAEDGPWRNRYACEVENLKNNLNRDRKPIIHDVRAIESVFE